MQKYQVNKTGESTVKGFALPSGFVLEITRSHRDNNNFEIEVVTCEADGKPALRDQEANVAAQKLSFAYNHATDDATDAALLTTHWEPLLDTWFGPANWIKL